MYQVSNASDIQGLLINGYSHHHFSTHMIFQFKEGSKPKEFIKAIYNYVQTAADWGPNMPKNMLNVSLTATGINILKGYDINPVTSAFGPTFCAGPASVMSQASLSDIGESDPSKWLFGNNTPQPLSNYTQIPVECMVHIYGLTVADRNNLVTIVSDAAKANAITEIFPIKSGNEYNKRLEQHHMKTGFVHFGYEDGMDNPSLDQSTNKMPGKKYVDPQNLTYFLVGYHGNPTYYSIVPEGNTEEAKFANNGFYNAFRMLQQDLQGFEDFLDHHAVHIALQIGKDVAFARQWLAAKLVGRWQDGSPLILTPEAPDPSKSKETNFGYSGDPMGLKCPITSHSRVTNPRDSTMTEGNSPIPRILRRGVPYGPTLKNKEEYDGQSGLAGIFLVGNLANAFELVSGWINRNNFTPDLAVQYPSTQDALLANRKAGTTTQTFPIPAGITNDAAGQIATINIDPAPILPQFIITIGSAYTFFPSMNALKSCFR